MPNAAHREVVNFCLTAPFGPLFKPAAVASMLPNLLVILPDIVASPGAVPRAIDEDAAAIVRMDTLANASVWRAAPRKGC